MAAVETRVRLSAPPELIWQAAADMRNAGWRSDLQQVRPLEGNAFEEVGRDGVRSRVTVADVRPEERCLLQVEGRASYGLRELVLRREGPDTEVTLRGEVLGRSALATLAERLYLRRFQRQYLRDLEAEVRRLTGERE